MPLRIDGKHQTESLTRESLSQVNQNGLGFNKALTGAQKIQRQELEEFLNRLDALGKKLTTSPTLRDLADFKVMVKTFLSSTFGQSRSLQESSFWDYSGRPKVLTKVSKIDQELEDLGRKILDDQTKPMDILAKIDEIRGLIIDLFA
ncbi:MAG: YaaR family protein [Desulfitobacteriaceae bacterium]